MAEISKLLCCRRTREGPLLPKPTPLPWSKVLVVCVVMFVGYFGVFMLFAFLPFMIHDFFPRLNSEELGHQAGYLAGAFYVGTLVSNPLWGWLADTWGRRPVLLMGVCGCVSAEILFGFSQNFGWAMGARILWGVLNGNMFGTTKVYVTEICDDTNQASAFAKVYAVGGVGRFLGPVFGGFLARPASKYPLLQIPFFCSYPYLLPCLVGGGLGILSLIAGCIFLTEPEKLREKDRREVSSTQRVSIQHTDGDSGVYTTYSEPGGKGSTEKEPLIQKRNVSQKTPVPLYGPTSLEDSLDVKQSEQDHTCFMPCVTCCTDCQESCTLHNAKSLVVRTSKAGVAKAKDTLTILHDRRVFICTVLYGMIAFLGALSNQLFPLLMVTNHSHGGYGMDDNEIGVALMVAAVCEFLWQLFAFPWISKCLGYRWTFRLGILLYVAATVVLPFSNQITGPIPVPADTSGSGSGSGSENYTDYCGNDLSAELSVNVDSVKRIPVYIWALLTALLGIQIMSRMMSFAARAVLIGNSTLQSTRGVVTGVGESMCAFASALAPIVGTPLFAWSESTGLGWPLNYHFVFDLLAVLGLLTIAVSLFLPKTVEEKREVFVNIDKMLQ